MQNHRILILISIFLLTSLIGYCQESSLQLTIKSDKEVYGVGDEIKLTAEIKNVSDEVVKFYMNANENVSFYIVIKDNNGKHYPIEGVQIEAGPTKLISLKPKEMLQYSFIGKISKRTGYIPPPDKTPKKGEYITVYGTFIQLLSNRFYLGDNSAKCKIQVLFRSSAEAAEELSGFSSEEWFEFLKDKWQGTLTSNPITIEVVEKKGISKAEILKIAQMICKKSGWEWNNINIYDENNRWHIVTKSLQDGDKVRIFIDKYTGEVLNVLYNFE